MSAEDVFCEWLTRGLSGCKFAAHIASRGGSLAFAQPTVNEVADVAEVVDGATANGFVSVLLFPTMRSETELVDFLAHLDAHPRWRITRRQGARESCTALSVTFTTILGDESQAMGFGPIAQMPVTRRAPHFALVVWAGERLNNYFDGGKPGTVNLAHAPHQLTHAAHDEMWRKTRETTEKYLTEPPDDSVWLRKIAFCLPTTSVPAQLF